MTSSDCTAALATVRMHHRHSPYGVSRDPSPLQNTVTVLYHPEGFPNDITDTASAKVGIVAPAITVSKTASAHSKIGDDVTYAIEICNTGTVPVVGRRYGLAVGRHRRFVRRNVCSGRVLVGDVDAYGHGW